jgi:hypothetical protein
VKIGDREIRLFKTIVDHRVEDETREEFLMRRHFVKKQIKDRKKYGIDFKYGN